MSRRPTRCFVFPIRNQGGLTIRYAAPIKLLNGTWGWVDRLEGEAGGGIVSQGRVHELDDDDKAALAAADQAIRDAVAALNALRVDRQDLLRLWFERGETIADPDAEDAST